MLSKILISFLIIMSSCALFNDPNRLQKIESDAIKDAVQLAEDVVEPAGDPNAH